MLSFRIDEGSPFRRLIGVGGVGTGMFFALEGDHTIGRNESRQGSLLDVRDYCKLHIVMHYVARLLGTEVQPAAFRVIAVSRVGDDVAGRLVLREMSQVGIDVQHVIVTAGKPTLFSVCFQYPDGGGGNVTTSNSACSDLSARDLNGIAQELMQDGAHTLALALPEVPLQLRAEFLRRATAGGAFRAASFAYSELEAAIDAGLVQNLDLLALNQEEAQVLAGCTLDPAQPIPFLQACLEFLRAKNPNLSLVVSAGKHGAYAFSNDEWDYCSAPSPLVRSTAGAGDALLAGILAGLAAGLPFMRANSTHEQGGEWRTALQTGVLLASYSVQSPHTIHPDACVETLCKFAACHGFTVAKELEDLLAELEQGGFSAAERVEVDTNISESEMNL